jgi:hypothetical protein
VSEGKSVADCNLASSNRDQWRLKNGHKLPHWPEIIYSDRLKVTTHYDTDRKKTKRHTTLLGKAGGLAAAAAKAGGMHRHMSLSRREIYRAEKRERNESLYYANHRQSI